MPDARVAYVDYDPVVLAHAKAKLATNRNVTVIEGDLRAPGPTLPICARGKLIDSASR